ncbi:hypothetical protein EB796_016269 [Bugula neritina]|uniref:Uncharacterized protein n=1 Tax=Bugula neritina TaxID=10212 RepID=A0A7J7JGH9_BUGNE|nr:hypothetical protein EB796_016269 [Bugula neritina]
MATTINQGMKDVDCVRLSGEKIIAEAYKAYQQKECELEKVKQAVCREFEIKEIMVEAKNAATKANQLLCYNHNVDIAKQAKGMLSELDTIKCIEFPCLDLQGYKLGHRGMYFASHY